MKHIKKFEELDFNQTIPQTTVSELTNYYACGECNALFKLFNKRTNHCLYCNGKDLNSVGFDKFYDEVSKRLDSDEQEDLEFVKSEELNTYVNLEGLPLLNIKESVGENKGVIRKAVEVMVGLLAIPIGIPIVANLSTNLKINVIKRMIIENYLLEKIEYDILDEVKYDIKQPTKLDEVFKRLKTIKKKLKKYPTLDDIINKWERTFRSYNIVNIRNRKDIDYLIDEIREYFNTKTEKEWISSLKNYVSYDESKNKVVDNGAWKVLLKNPNYVDYRDQIRQRGWYDGGIVDN